VLTCFRTRRRIGAYLDGALEANAAASVGRHLAECASCRREAEGVRRMKALLQRALGPETVPAPPDWTGFWPCILRGIEARRHLPATKPHAGRRRARWALGGALAVALVVGTTLWQWPGQWEGQRQTAAPPILEKPVLVSTTAVEHPVPIGTAVEDPVLISSADTEHPDGSVMIYHTPERDMSVVWVFGVSE
jgi:predicted anti-sigma-YlaC factor YlaD